MTIRNHRSPVRRRMRPTDETLATVAARDEGRCARCGQPIGGQRSIDWSLHHRRPAKAGGDRRPESHLPGNLVLLHGSGTTACHGHVEGNRTESYNLGLLVKEPTSPCEKPIEHAVHGLVLLDDEGGWTCAS